MKRFAAMVLSLALMSAMVSTVALADYPPAQAVNPQQKGHVAYLEAQYTKREAQKILTDYGRADVHHEEAPVATSPPGTVIAGGGAFVPNTNTNSSASVLTTLRPGDYFVDNGLRYRVERFTYVSNAPVLVAYRVSASGYILDITPRYFYL